ncbi:MAG: class I adenylate-forming enzyme family protein [Bacteroidota bacterium]|nr:class I adenylate-forming enzyme family protein [Bacteroidota bacterium]
MLGNEILEKINHARTLSQDKSEAGYVGYENIGELIFKRARDYDTKPFLIYCDLDGNRREDNYKDFFMLCGMCANMMYSFGLRRGDRIATISHNHADTVLHYFAAWLMGICVVPVSLSEDDHRIHYILENSGAKLVFLRKDYSERIQKIIDNIPSVQLTLLCGEQTAALPTNKSVRWFDEELLSARSIFSSDEAVTKDDEALIVYTSGTTGNPKGVVLTQYNLLADAKGISEWHGIANSQRMMCVLPIHHVNGTIVTLVTPMYAGASVVLNQKFQSEHFFDRIENENVGVVSVVPTLLAFLLEYYKSRSIPSKPPTLRHIICGAGPLTVELGEQFEDRFGIRIVHGYGLSETTCYSCYLPISLSDGEHTHWMRDYGFPSIGCAIPQNEMMIADEEGNELPPSQKGEIAIRGFNVMKYYYNNDEANEKTFSYGWFRSGDEGFYELDDQGLKYFFITGRLKELIIRGGVNISPLEIDEVIARCPGVKAGIAVGFENDFYGEEVGAYVQKLKGTNIVAEDVIRFCRENLPFSKAPKVVIFGDDIPVTSTGKYQRNKCKPLFSDWRAVQFRKS